MHISKKVAFCVFKLLSSTYTCTNVCMYVLLFLTHGATRHVWACFTYTDWFPDQSLQYCPETPGTQMHTCMYVFIFATHGGIRHVWAYFTYTGIGSPINDCNPAPAETGILRYPHAHGHGYGWVDFACFTYMDLCSKSMTTFRSSLVDLFCLK
jgi:hypothetical protein